MRIFFFILVLLVAFWGSVLWGAERLMTTIVGPQSPFAGPAVLVLPIGILTAIVMVAGFVWRWRQGVDRP